MSKRKESDANLSLYIKRELEKLPKIDYKLKGFWRRVAKAWADFYWGRLH